MEAVFSYCTQENIYPNQKIVAALIIEFCCSTINNQTDIFFGSTKF